MKTLKHLVILTLVAVFVLAFVASGFAQSEASSWPRELKAEKYTIIIYQPQNESYANGKLKTRAAFSIKADDAESPTFGALWATANMNVDRVDRIMSLASIKVDAVRFPVDVEESKVERFKKFLEEEIPKWDIEISQDELITSLEQVEVSSSENLGTDPPLIIFSKEPAMLVLIDGEPSLRDLDDKYQSVVNTAVFMVKERKSGDYYLNGGEYWYKADSAKGPWKYQKKVSKNLEKLKEKMRPADEGSEDSGEKSNVIPSIVVSTEPAELIVIEGEEKFVPIQQTNLLYVDNTESDLFMNVATQEYFILLSGRWFTSANPRGPWKYLAADQLPEDFAKIPEGSPKDAVLSGVPGTKAAQEAKYDAQMPQTAAVDRKTAAANAKVEYNGAANFQKIDGTSLQYAVNTSSTVIKSGNKYYLCDNAIWFVSSSPNGPWQVSETRPGEVEKIPPSNPVYNVKYVYIYDTTPTVVYVGYTPGYTGCYVYGSTVVYGTGYHYSGWHGTYYYPRPATYGFAVRYNPWTGWSVGFGMSYGAPTGWYSFHGYWGPHHYVPPVHYHRPLGGYYGHRDIDIDIDTLNVNRNYNNRVNRNVYNNRAGVAGYSRTTRSASYNERLGVARISRTTQSGAAIATGSGRGAAVRSTQKNNVLVGKNGNVYRTSASGVQKYEKNNWSRSQSSSREVNATVQSRKRGSQRTQSFQSYQRTTSTSSSRRSSGGGRRRR